MIENVQNYRRVVGEFNRMFEIMNPRISEQLWLVDGIGSCNITRSTSEAGLVGTNGEQIIYLRERRNEEVSGKSTASPCLYHREGCGCILGDLKGPNCVSLLDSPAEVQRRFRIPGYAFREEVFNLLQFVLTDERDPQTRADFVEVACIGVRQLTNHIAKFPLINQTKTS